MTTTHRYECPRGHHFNSATAPTVCPTCGHYPEQDGGAFTDHGPYFCPECEHVASGHAADGCHVMIPGPSVPPLVGGSWSVCPCSTPGPWEPIGDVDAASRVVVSNWLPNGSEGVAR